MSSDRPPVARPPLGGDFVIPLLAAGFALYFFYSIADLAWEAKANGVLIGSVLTVLILVQIVRSALQISRGKASLGFDPLLRPRDALAKRIGMVVLTAGFIAAIDWMGLTLSLFLAMATALYLMGVRKTSRLFWVPAIAAAVAYLMFIVVLKSEMPHGPIEKLLSMLFF